MMTSYENQVVWIIGASSGIGAALARELFKRGALLALSARRKDELDRLKLELDDTSKVFVLDITDPDMTLRTAHAIRASFGRIDRIIFLAAAYVPMKTTELDIAVTKGIIDTNLTGAFNVVHAVVPILKSQQQKGQLALCGSVAGYIGLPEGQPYSATKAALINLAESLHAECRDLIDIKLINPGFVSTPLTDKNRFEMPMIMQPEDAANAIADGLLSRSFEIHFPKKFTLLLKLLRLLPYPLSLRVTRKLV
ncbi:SDR family NAD(P)-dependent oxidoreductase [Cellvibrio sp. pealriver]|uniref:SDR family NAD(P)-dependent oxidoreductase n=1 Tax=Cellvibrio sp. pealriver TaxID=1622269 RepID=UPI00066FB6BC|nr:SDR family NAD(P)-dependent oxidoreductase [Cellvibrio sp. pealriver]